MSKEKFTRTHIQRILRSAGLDSTRAMEATGRIIDSMAAALAAGETIELRGLGTLEPRKRKARILRNPRTMAAVNVPARRVVFFRTGQELQRALNGERT